jgi:hypothetical protein
MFPRFRIEIIILKILCTPRATISSISFLEILHSLCPFHARLTVVLIDETSLCHCRCGQGQTETQQRPTAFTQQWNAINEVPHIRISLAKCFFGLEACRDMSPTDRWQFSETRYFPACLNSKKADGRND